jgi:HAD superfamily hydrolase (TIGR01509 family)
VITVLVSDLGNVLLPFDDGPPVAKIAAACNVPDAAARFKAIVKAMGLGRGLISQADFHARIVAELGLTLSFDQFAHTYSDMFTVDEATLALVANARVERRVLLSNTDGFHWDFIVARYPHVLAPFDDLVTSHQTHFSKPDAAIFQHAVGLTGRAPSEHLFIDDLHSHVAGARRTGLQAALFVSARQLEIDLRAHSIQL